MSRIGFGVRMALAGLMTLSVILMIGQRLVTTSVRDGMIEENTAVHQLDAQQLAAYLDGRDAVEGDRTLGEMLDAIVKRPAVVQVELVDTEGRVVSASPSADVGEIETGMTRRVARSGESYAGPEREPRDVDNEFTYIVQVSNPGGEQYALEVDADASQLDARVVDLNHQLLLLSVVALPVAALLFFLLGGGRLVQRHNRALDRAQRDALTGLGNRRHFEARHAEEIREARRRREPLVLAIVDVDDFKLVNDRHGHRRGDEVLRAVARALASGRAADEAFRFGGDEFAVLMPNIDSQGAREAMERRVREAAAATGGVTLSVGLAALGAGDKDDMFEQADMAVYAAKRVTGTAICHVPGTDSDQAAHASQRMQRLADALDAREVVADLVPLHDFESGTALGVIARPAVACDGRLLTPSEAVVSAQHLGRTGELFEQTLNDALSRASDFGPDRMLVVGMAAEMFQRGAPGESLASQVRAAGLEPEHVFVELVALSPAGGRSLAPKVLDLRAQGFKLAGTVAQTGDDGPLTALAAMPMNLDCVRLDADLVARARDDLSPRAFVAATVAYAGTFGAAVVVEPAEAPAEDPTWATRSEYPAGARR